MTHTVEGTEETLLYSYRLGKIPSLWRVVEAWKAWGLVRQGLCPLRPPGEEKMWQVHLQELPYELQWRWQLSVSALYKYKAASFIIFNRKTCTRKYAPQRKGFKHDKKHYNCLLCVNFCYFSTIKYNSVWILLQIFHLLYRVRNKQICGCLSALLLYFSVRSISYMLSLSFSTLNEQQQLLSNLLRMIFLRACCFKAMWNMLREVTNSLQVGKTQHAQRFIRSLI